MKIREIRLFVINFFHKESRVSKPLRTSKRCFCSALKIAFLWGFLNNFQELLSGKSFNYNFKLASGVRLPLKTEFQASHECHERLMRIDSQVHFKVTLGFVRQNVFVKAKGNFKFGFFFSSDWLNFHKCKWQDILQNDSSKKRLKDDRRHSQY